MPALRRRAPFLRKPDLQSAGGSGSSGGEAALARLRTDFTTEAEGLRASARERTLEKNAAPGTGFGALIDFASNDYLGLRTDPRLAEGGAAAARLFGSGSGASRLVRAADGAAFAVEHRVAQLGGFEKSPPARIGFFGESRDSRNAFGLWRRMAEESTKANFSSMCAPMRACT